MYTWTELSMPLVRATSMNTSGSPVHNFTSHCKKENHLTEIFCQKSAPGGRKSLPGMAGWK
jgi:hypothetical protein